MSLLREKVSEVSRSLLPIVVLVLLLSFVLVKPDTEVVLRFLLGAALLLLGLGIFLLGVDLGMNPIGDYMAQEMAMSRSPAKIAAMAFLLGFLVTVAEPDLLILGKQVQNASGAAIGAMTMVYLVSAGVGVLIMLGTFRLLRGRSYPGFMGLAYLGIFALSIFVSEEFLAISFDSSGATTGALTTPFVLALSAGLSRVKGGRSTEQDAFGMVGVMSAGPMYALMLMSIITRQQNIQGEVQAFVAQTGILAPVLHHLPGVFRESALALLPLSVLFFAMNGLRFKASGRAVTRIIKGLLYTLLGLTIFLTGVYAGFLDMGQIIGSGIASKYAWLLPIIGFLIGMIVVLVEPAVLVLGQQIESTTGGRIPGRIIKITLSLGVALAVMGSMVRIMVPAVKLWYFLLPGFALAIILSFLSDPIFVGIAYDAGGVASGPMTATFVLAFAQGAAANTPTANVLVDGFGVIAMVAMAPVVSLMLVGAIFRHKESRIPGKERHQAATATDLAGQIEFYDCLVAIVNRGLADRANELALEMGAQGATIIHGRGSGGHDMKVLSIEVQKEKELVFWLVDARLSDQIARHLYHELELGEEGGGTIFLLPAGALGLSGAAGSSVGQLNALDETEPASPRTSAPAPDDAASSGNC